MTLAKDFTDYSTWRDALSLHIAELQRWLEANDLSTQQSAEPLRRLQTKLTEEKLMVAFVAEFSRGKSELINAIFFSEYGSRILPSSVGRTTMCPTELFYDANKPNGVELLPIATRTTNTTVSDYKNQSEAWQHISLDINSAEGMRKALFRVSETTRVSPEEASNLGFEVGDDAQGGTALYQVDVDGLVEVPRWRHALINFPHPMLRQGLIILDTPGLNAIGAEPELTLSLIPSAHVILFVLALDTGVTQSDLTVWKEHIVSSHNGTRQRGRLVALNKIDGQWDDLKSNVEINREIQQQVQSCSTILGLPEKQIFPVSAQKGLVAKVNKDKALLERSRVLPLEQALSTELIPAKRDIMIENIEHELGDVIANTRSLMSSRLLGLQAQIAELSELRGKNAGVVDYMMKKIKTEKNNFERGLQRYYAVRRVYSNISNKLYAHLGIESLRKLTKTTREEMLEASFSHQLSAAISRYFSTAHDVLADSEKEIKDLHAMMCASYHAFSTEHSLKLAKPIPLNLDTCKTELKRLENWCDIHLKSAITLITKEKKRIVQRFFEEVSLHMRRNFERANREIETWLHAIITPLEMRVREHQSQLKRRLESIRRIHSAADSLETHLAELKNAEYDFLKQRQELDEIIKKTKRFMV